MIEPMTERDALVAYLRAEATLVSANASRARDPRVAGLLHRDVSLIRRLANEIAAGKHCPAVPSTIGPDDPTPIVTEPKP